MQAEAGDQGSKFWRDFSKVFPLFQLCQVGGRRLATWVSLFTAANELCLKPSV